MIECLTVFFMSMIPVVELRGAIPVGIAAGLHPALTYLLAVVGNLIPAPLIILLIRKIFELLRRVPWLGPKITWLENRAHLKGRVIHKYGLAGLFILVAVPLPGTGAWTGALAAALLDIRLKRAMPAIALGVLVAGAVVLALSCGVAFVVS
ncbi:MAG: small multi-drug export protein [Oscillospiraceae bacterium]|nr:small multi-drug export protein [Oscillospiraceae bacterium]MCD8375556.1 small multi-drug export protein [Oscillospiraceae bacterium]